MASPRAGVDPSDDEVNLTEPNPASSLYAPWQTFSALATETGQAVRDTFLDSSVDTSGNVQQGLPYHVSQTEHKASVSQSQPEAVPVDGQVSLAQRETAESEPDNSIHQAAVQTDISRVTRKIISTDATTEVVLRFNFLTGSEAKAALLCVAVSIILGAGVLIAEFRSKMEKGGSALVVRRTSIYVWNVTVGGTCLTLVTFFLGCLIWRVLEAVRLRKHWKHRQRRNVTLILVEGILQWLNLAFYVIPNAMMTANPCYLVQRTWFYCGFIRWTCWNTIFMIFLIHAYSTRIRKHLTPDTTTVSAAAIEHGFERPEGHAQLIMDGPWLLLWPCLLIWPFFEAVVGYGFLSSAADENPRAIYECEGSPNDQPEQLTCGVNRSVDIIVDFIVALAVLYFAITCLLLLAKLRGYRKQPYTFVQVGLVYNTLQLWLRLAVMTFFMLCLMLLWLVGDGWCSSLQFSWLGLMPMQIVMTANMVVLCYVATPINPSEHAAASAVWLQEFAWTEADKPVKVAARSAMVPHNRQLAREPILCFETMMNLLYWSCFVYDHSREPATPRRSLSKASSISNASSMSKASNEGQDKLAGTSFTARTTLTLETAMSLYKLTESQSFWETQQDTRCLLGWGNNTVVVAFRGTASMKNALADLQAWRIAHPPVRGQTMLGTRPLVHVGFLKSWLAGGLKVKVINHVLAAVCQCKQQSKSDQPVTVFVTGHSLGGALANLAAFDIRKQLLDNKQSNTNVVCYTFAAPRTGNHAFAREYNAIVPDTWSVINDQDVVTREGKMLFLYKRPGQRVILNARGHMMVRPTHMEASVQKTTAGQSVRHHLLTNYFHAILAVVLAQFTGLGVLDGMEGVIRLAEASPYIRDILETQMGMKLPEMHAFVEAEEGSRAVQSLPGAHLPSKGFWLIKRPTAPSTAAAPSVTGRLMNKLSFKTARTSPSVQRASDGL